MSPAESALVTAVSMSVESWLTSEAVAGFAAAAWVVVLLVELVFVVVLVEVI